MFVFFSHDIIVKILLLLWGICSNRNSLYGGNSSVFRQYLSKLCMTCLCATGQRKGHLRVSLFVIMCAIAELSGHSSEPCLITDPHATHFIVTSTALRHISMPLLFLHISPSIKMTKCIVSNCYSGLIKLD